MVKWLKQLRWLILPAALAIAIAPAPVLAQTAEPLTVHITQVDTSAFPTVTVYISVTNAAGEPAPVNLDRIRLYENGKRMKLDSIAGIGQSEPLTTMLVMDISGSMKYSQKLESSKAAAIAYVNQMRSGDEAGLVTFDTQITYVLPTTSDHDRLKAAINSLQTGSDTAMYDAVYEAIDLLQNLSGRKAVIILTDGMDNRSKHTAQEVIERIGPAGLSISTIGLGNPADKTATLSGIDEPALRNLAEQAGGTYGFANDPAALKALYEQYGRALQSEYVITYTSPAALRDGLNRSLSVSLTEDIPALAGESSYNPGGLVPETAASPSASWPLFVGLLIVLAAMLFAPLGIQQVAALVHNRNEPPAAKPSNPSQSSKSAAAPKIKLSETNKPAGASKKPSRIKLK
jgi:Ca-activated chloride channel homolog